MLTTSRTGRATVALPSIAHGRPDGIPLVLLHGLSDSGPSFAPLLERLPDSVRAYAPTLRGHGDAPKPAEGYDAGALAADVIAFLDAAGIDRAVVAGHSMGTIVAVRVALDAPERVAGLVLLGGRATFGAPELAPLSEELRALRDPIDPEWIRGFQEGTIARPIAEGRLDGVVAESLKMPARVWHALVDGALLADHTAELGRIAAPVLVACGGRDDIAPPACGEELARLIPRARLTVDEDGGHAFHWEDPDRAAREIAAFIDGLG